MFYQFEHSHPNHSETVTINEKYCIFGFSLLNSTKGGLLFHLLLPLVIVFLWTGVISCWGSESSVVDLGAVNLRCESLVNPLGMDVIKPRLSWRISSEGIGVFQSAYRIMVADSKENLERNQGNIWDSGIVKSQETLEIVYGGKPLESGKRYYWKVKVWNQAASESPWSEIASWETGLLHETDWQGVWINDGKKNPVVEEDFYQEDPAPLFRHEFKCDKKVKEARLVTVHGDFTLSLERFAF